MSIDLSGLDDLPNFYTDSPRQPLLPVEFPELEAENVIPLQGSLGYQDVTKYLGISEISDEQSCGVLLETLDESYVGIVVAKYGKLHRYTVSGTEEYGFEAAYTDTCQDGEVYATGDARLTPFAYRRAVIPEHMSTERQGAYFAALERCGYDQLRPRKRQSHHGWLRSMISLSK